MINVVIIENKKIGLEKLVNTLKEAALDLTVKGLFTSAKESIHSWVCRIMQNKVVRRYLAKDSDGLTKFYYPIN